MVVIMAVDPVLGGRRFTVEFFYAISLEILE